MTPQLQQAIKLLQLSRMELVDLVREEMLENPILEDDLEVGGNKEPDTGSEPDGDIVTRQIEQAGNTELPALEGNQETPAAEVKADGSAVNEIDWENYLDNYSMAAPMPSYRPDSDELPSLEATLTRTESLHDHLVWQLKMSDMNDQQLEIGMLILGNIDPDGYLKEPPMEDLAADLDCSLELMEEVLEKIQKFDPVGIGARNLEECMLIQAMLHGQDDDLVVKMIKSHLCNLEKKNYQAIART